MVKNKDLLSEDELKASVKTYIEMLSKEQSEYHSIKKDYYVKLSNEFGRIQKHLSTECKIFLMCIQY